MLQFSLAVPLQHLQSAAFDSGSLQLTCDGRGMTDDGWASCIEENKVEVKAHREVEGG